METENLLVGHLIISRLSSPHQAVLIFFAPPSIRPVFCSPPSVSSSDSLLFYFIHSLAQSPSCLHPSCLLLSYITLFPFLLVPLLWVSLISLRLDSSILSFNSPLLFFLFSSSVFYLRFSSFFYLSIILLFSILSPSFYFLQF